MSDFTYLRLEDDADARILDLGADIRAGFWENSIAYRLIGEAPATLERDTAVDLYTGVRWGYLKQEINLTPNVPVLPGRSLGDSVHYAEWLVGFRAMVPLDDDDNPIMGGVRADIGGFDIGSGSELTWQVLAGIDWAFAERWTAKFGWKHLDLDYVRGGGRSAFGMDGYMTGPYVSVGHKFSL